MRAWNWKRNAKSWAKRAPKLDEERTLRIKAQQFIVDPIFKTPA